jgi:hypothetical protein
MLDAHGFDRADDGCDGPWPAARLSFLGSGEPYELLDELGPADALAFDALALSTSGWQAPLDARPAVPPHRHPDRRRIRLITLVAVGVRQPAEAPLATVIRRCDDGATQIVEGGDGPMPDALRRAAAGRELGGGRLHAST